MNKLLVCAGYLVAVFLLCHLIVMTCGTTDSPPFTKSTPDCNYLQNICVKVATEYGTGSGVVVQRSIAGKRRVFVWTAGHVVDSLRQEDGTFSTAKVILGDQYSPLPAEVIAYSSRWEEDLALLELSGEVILSASTRFIKPNFLPVGTPVVHCGAPSGFNDSVNLGIISFTDRIIRGKTMDQVSVAGFPGSSGGGVFTKDGQCIGLLTQGVGPGLCLIVPTRRIRKWARSIGIEWAVDADVKVPLCRAPIVIE